MKLYIKRRSSKKRSLIHPYKKYLGSFVPNWLMMRPEISQGAKLCYGRLSQFFGKHGRCFPGRKRLALELGVSTRMVSQYIKELNENELIHVSRRYGKSNRYDFFRHHWADEAEKFMEKRVWGAGGEFAPDHEV